jgi:hypothetical protein
MRHSKGKYTKMNRLKPRAIGLCDYSGLDVRRCDMVWQKEYSGNGLVTLGLLVNPKFADKPNPQKLVPPIRLDPIPIINARPDPILFSPYVPTLNLDVAGASNITLSIEQTSNSVFNFSGVLTGNIVIYIQDLFNQFYANNLTTGDYTLGMQIIGRSSAPLIIPYVNPETLQGPLVVNNFVSLQFVPT